MDIPSNISGIIYKVDSGEKITDEERRELIDFLNSHNISVKKLLKEMGMYLPTTYHRVLREIKGLLQQKVELAITKAEEGGMAREAVSRSKAIGRIKFSVADKIVSEFYSTALEMGYPETEEGLVTFFRDAVNFFVNNMNIIDEYEDLKVVTSGLVKMMKPEFKRLIIMKIVKNIALEALKLSAEGKTIDEETLDDVLKWATNRLIEVSEYGSPS